MYKLVDGTGFASWWRVGVCEEDREKASKVGEEASEVEVVKKKILEAVTRLQILETVTRLQRCKVMELIAKIRTTPEDIQALIDSGDLVEVEYILPSINYRIKSFLLPKGTKILLNEWVFSLMCQTFITV